MGTGKILGIVKNGKDWRVYFTGDSSIQRLCEFWIGIRGEDIPVRWVIKNIITFHSSGYIGNDELSMTLTDFGVKQNVQLDTEMLMISWYWEWNCVLQDKASSQYKISTTLCYNNRKSQYPDKTQRSTEGLQPLSFWGHHEIMSWKDQVFYYCGLKGHLRYDCHDRKSESDFSGEESGASLMMNASWGPLVALYQVRLSRNRKWNCP